MNEAIPGDRPASEASVAELIALERARLEREERRATSRRRAVLVGILVLFVAGVVAIALVNQHNKQRSQERLTCIFSYTQQNIPGEIAEGLCD